MKKLFLLSFIFKLIIINNISISAAHGEDFSLILLPDTQNDAQFFPSIFMSQTQWIVNNKTAQNIVFVTHVGDIVNSANSTSQYNNADAAMDLLDASNVAYSVGPGNHDMTSGSLYETYFGISRFSGKSWYGGYYGDNNYNNYSFFSASGMDFIIINLQYQWTPDAAILEWADSLLKAYPNRRGIVESHNILKIDNTWSNEGIYLALKDNPNLFLMVCGHNYTITDGAAYRAELGDDGHTIHIMLADYQAFSFLSNGGYLRILRFSPADDKIYATTYSPYVDKYITSYPDQMEMIYDMISGDEEILVDTKIFLEGPYSSSSMNTILNSNLPTTQPYGVLPWNYNGLENVADGFFATHTDIVDWVLVELREGTTSGTRIGIEARFLKSDGTIVDVDGSSPLVMTGITAGDYFIVVKHRNHLSVMSSTAVSFSSSPSITEFDFTSGDGSQFYGGSSGAKELEPEVWGMIAGDANGNGQVQNNDREDLWKIQNGQSGYKSGDYNLNGQVQNNDNEIYFETNNGKGSAVPN